MMRLVIAFMRLGIARASQIIAFISLVMARTSQIIALMTLVAVATSLVMNPTPQAFGFASRAGGA